MTRRSRTHWLRSAALGFTLALAACGSEPEPTTKPVTRATPPSEPAETSPAPIDTRTNLVLITIDTTRADALSAYGQPLPTTPTLDRLALEGVLFEQASTTNPETFPAHATLLTGQWPFAHGVRANAGHVLAPRHVTLAEVLLAEGYRTGAETAAKVLRSDTGITQGFDRVRDPETFGVRLKRVVLDGKPQTIPTRTGEDITEGGIRFLRQGGTPFFLWLHYFDPHDPYQPPEEHRERIGESPYHGEVAAADAALGRFFEALEAQGLAQNTLVVVTSDHGEGLGDHGEPTHSYLVYESTMRVPLLMRGAGLPKGRRVAAPVRTLDVMPTVLELLGVEAPSGMQGVSLVEMARDEGAAPVLPSYSEASRFGATFDLPMLRSYREGRWKYHHKVNPELYDLENDPGELENRIADEPETAKRLREKLAALLDSAPASDDARIEVDAETAAQLAELGYATAAPNAQAEDPLALWGEDPLTKIDDTRLISEAQGLIDRKAWAEAWKRIEPALERNPESVYILGLATRNLIGLERSDDAIAAGQKILAKHPCDRGSLDRLAAPLRAKQRYAELVAMHANAFDACPDFFENLNNYAWVLATLPPDALRDGTRAVALLEPAIDAQTDVDPTVLDTLAAAKAEAGDFMGAVATQRDAIARLRAKRADPQLIALLEGHLREFEAGRPIREP